MQTRAVLCALFAAFAVGCAAGTAGLPTAQVPATDPKVQRALDHAAFFHPECPPSRIAVRRMSQNGRYLELDVCGSVRRYQDVSPELSGNSAPYVDPTWVDVTADTAR
jgi:hypothetical protein